jgi:hypothetical protein
LLLFFVLPSFSIADDHVLLDHARVRLMGRVAKDDPSTVHRTYSEQKGFGFIRSDGGGVVDFF